MIPAVAQTLAEVLTSRTSLISKEQISFNPPQVNQDNRPVVSLYCYHIQPGYGQPAIQSGLARLEDSADGWLNLLFLISVSDFTALGEQRLLSEILLLFLNCPYLPEDALAPQLRGQPAIPVQVSIKSALDAMTLWTALGVPLRPALHLQVTVPLGSCPPLSKQVSQAIAGVTHHTGNPLPEPKVLAF